MELRHLKYFVAVAEDLNFTRAAKRLGIAQPPLSRQIRSLENEIGVQLFERRSGRVFLTDAGRRFLDGARTALQEAVAAITLARQSRDGGQGTVRVGFGKGLGDVVSTVINYHIRMHPDVEVDVRDVFSGFQIEGLTNRKFDVGFSHGQTTSGDLVSEKLFREGLSVVVARSSPLAKRTRVTMQTLVGQNLLLIDRQLSPVVHDKILELCRNAKGNIDLVATDSTCYDEAGALMIASGRGISIAVGRSPSHPSFADRLVAVPLRESTAWVEVCVSWRRHESSPVVLNFVESARRLLRRRSGVQDLSRLHVNLRLTNGRRSK